MSTSPSRWRLHHRLIDWLTPSLPAPEPSDPWEAIRDQVSLIEVRARAQLRDQFAGDFRSAFRGRGLEFTDSRAYLPGDDVRFIDWNVTARRDEPYVKQFVEEREQTVFLLLDVSASESFGTVGRSVRDYAIEVAGLLGFAAAVSNDRVGGAAFSDRIEYALPPRKGTRQVLRLLHDLLSLEPAGRGTDLRGALEYVSRLLRRESVIFVLSDFNTPADDWDAALRRLGFQHDIVALVVHDPHEADLPAEGLLTLADSESGGALVVQASVAAPQLRAQSAARLADLPRRLRAANVDYALLPTNEPYQRKLMALFRARTRRQ